MKTNGFQASTSGGKRVFAISIIVALILASLSAVGVFAAASPARQSQKATQSSSKISGGQLRELMSDLRWYNNFRTQPGRIANSTDQSKLGQYLDQYAVALRQAFAIMVGTGNNASSQGNSSSGQQNTGSNGNFNSSRSASQQLAVYLHTMRGLQDKIEGVAGPANSSSNNNGNNAGNGIPITGGSSSSTGSTSTGTSGTSAATATPTTSSSAGTTSIATATATIGATATPTSGTGSTSTGTTSATATPTSSTGSTSSGTTTATATPTSSTSSTSSGSTSASSSPSINSNAQSNTSTNGNQSNTNQQQIGGGQFRDLQADLRWYNNFRSEPANFTNGNGAKISQYLDQYAFALRQAFAIIVGTGNNASSQGNNSNGQNTGSNGNFNSSRSSSQQLGVYLHMMRGLQDKIMGASNNNTFIVNATSTP